MKRQTLTRTIRRAVYERTHGLCERCGELGEEIDHIRSLQFCDDPSEADSLNNLQLLCKKCHDSKSLRETIRYHSRRGRIDPETGYPRRSGRLTGQGSWHGQRKGLAAQGIRGAS